MSSWWMGPWIVWREMKLESQALPATVCISIGHTSTQVRHTLKQWCHRLPSKKLTFLNCQFLRAENIPPWSDKQNYNFMVCVKPTVFNKLWNSLGSCHESAYVLWPNKVFAILHFSHCVVFKRMFHVLCCVVLWYVLHCCILFCRVLLLCPVQSGAISRVDLICKES
jgi:hypothetical protein